MMMDPGFSAARNQPLTMEIIAEFLDGLLVRDKFIVHFTREFQLRERLEMQHGGSADPFIGVIIFSLIN